MKIILLGVYCILAQILLLREATHVFWGNELTASLFLFFWMLETGLFARLGMKAKGDLFFLASPPALVASYLFIILTPWISGVPFGEIPSLYVYVPILALSLLPVAFCTGYFFSGLTARKENFLKNYFLETLGFLAGSLLFACLVSEYLPTDTVLLVFLVVYPLVSLRFPDKHLMFRMASVMIPLAGLLLFFFTDYNALLNRLAFPGENVIQKFQTKFGNYSVTERNGQKKFFKNNRPVYISDKHDADEIIAYISLYKKIATSSVLVFSNPFSTLTEKLLKTGTSKLQILEDDEKAFTRLQGKHRQLFSDIYFGDIWNFAQNRPDRFDIVIVDRTSPPSLYENRFYTLEFYNYLKRILKEDGLLVTMLDIPGNFINATSLRFENVHFQSLKSAFKNNTVIIGHLTGHTFFSSSKKLTEVLPDNNTDTFGRSFMETQTRDLRRSDLLKELNSVPDIEITVNSRLHPELFLYYLKSYLFKITGKDMTGFMLLLALFILLPVFLILGYGIFKKDSFVTGCFSIYSFAFTLMFIEISSLLFYHSRFGNLYVLLSFLVTSTMAGGLFAFTLKDRLSTSLLSKTPVTTLAYLVLLISYTIAIMLLGNTGLHLTTFIILLFNVISGFLVGVRIIHITKSINFEKQLSIYLWDMVGAASAVIVFSLILFPCLGFYKAMMAPAILLIVSIFLPKAGSHSASQ